MAAIVKTLMDGAQSSVPSRYLQQRAVRSNLQQGVDGSGNPQWFVVGPSSDEGTATFTPYTGDPNAIKWDETGDPLNPTRTPYVEETKTVDTRDFDPSWGWARQHGLEPVLSAIADYETDGKPLPANIKKWLDEQAGGSTPGQQWSNFVKMIQSREADHDFLGINGIGGIDDWGPLPVVAAAVGGAVAAGGGAAAEGASAIPAGAVEGFSAASPEIATSGSAAAATSAGSMTGADVASFVGGGGSATGGTGAAGGGAAAAGGGEALSAEALGGGLKIGSTGASGITPGGVATETIGGGALGSGIGAQTGSLGALELSELAPATLGAAGDMFGSAEDFGLTPTDISTMSAAGPISSASMLGELWKGLPDVAKAALITSGVGLVSGTIQGIGNAVLQENLMDKRIQAEKDLLAQKTEEEKKAAENKRALIQSGSYFGVKLPFKPAAGAVLRRPDGSPVYKPGGGLVGSRLGG